MPDIHLTFRGACRIHSESVLRIAITADLHWALRPSGDAATQRLVDFLSTNTPDALIIAGDIGTHNHFADCLKLFRDLSCLKALVPGNHDVWVELDDPRGDSMALYTQLLPQIADDHGFLFLDNQPLVLKESDLAIVGTMNWYDYSWSIDRLKATTPNWEYHLYGKLFSRGRHNDANFVRWGMSDEAITQRLVGQFGTHLEQALSQVKRAMVVTHHPCFRELNFPGVEPPTMDRLLWEAFSGNQLIEELLLKHHERIPLAFSGHTHRARESSLGSIRGHNIGGDYHFKRLLLVSWPQCTVEAHEFPGA